MRGHTHPGNRVERQCQERLSGVVDFYREGYQSGAIRQCRSGEQSPGVAHNGPGPQARLPQSQGRNEKIPTEQRLGSI